MSDVDGAGVAPTTSPTSASQLDRPDRVSTPSRRWDVIIFVAAVVARLVLVARQGGMRGTFGYDAGVYFAGSDSLIHGRLPYRDFVQLHPPVIDLVLTPITALTHVVSDHTAFFVGVVAFTLLGGVNAVLTARVGLRLGFGRAGSIAAAGVYALWYGSIESEFLIKLEPVGNFFLLLALLFALRADATPARRRPLVLAGVALGLAVSTKIWWVLPAVAVVVWVGLRHRSIRAAVVTLGGMVGAAVVVNLPFFAAAPSQMWHMVVLDQLGRKRRHSLAARVVDMTTLARLHHLSHHERLIAEALFVVVLAAVVVAALRVRAAWPAVGLLALQFLVLVIGPSWYPYYTDFLTVGLALTVGGAAASVRVRSEERARRPRVVGGVVAAGIAVLTVGILAAGPISAQAFRGGPQLARAVRHLDCVTSDSPVALIEIDALSRGLATGCPNWVDVLGTIYGPYRSKQPVARNTKWHRGLLAYLRRGQATILLQSKAQGITPALMRKIAAHGVLAKYSYSVVYRSPG